MGRSRQQDTRRHPKTDVGTKKCALCGKCLDDLPRKTVDTERGEVCLCLPSCGGGSRSGRRCGTRKKRPAPVKGPANVA